jgi:hypothetical protein
MPMVHDGRDSIPEGITTCHVVVIAYDPAIGTDLLLGTGKMPRAAIRFVTVVERDCPIAEAPIVVRTIDHLGASKMQMLFDEDITGLAVFIAGILEDDWADMEVSLKPTNANARAHHAMKHADA